VRFLLDLGQGGGASERRVDPHFRAGDDRQLPPAVASEQALDDASSQLGAVSMAVAGDDDAHGRTLSGARVGAKALGLK
jgi:hypothetical protein